MLHLVLLPAVLASLGTSQEPAPVLYAPPSKCQPVPSTAGPWMGRGQRAGHQPLSLHAWLSPAGTYQPAPAPATHAGRGNAAIPSPTAAMIQPQPRTRKSQPLFPALSPEHASSRGYNYLQCWNSTLLAGAGPGCTPQPWGKARQVVDVAVTGHDSTQTAYRTVSNARGQGLSLPSHRHGQQLRRHQQEQVPWGGPAVNWQQLRGNMCSNGSRDAALAEGSIVLASSRGWHQNKGPLQTCQPRRW